MRWGRPCRVQARCDDAPQRMVQTHSNTWVRRAYARDRLHWCAQLATLAIDRRLLRIGVLPGVSVLLRIGILRVRVAADKRFAADWRLLQISACRRSSSKRCSSAYMALGSALTDTAKPTSSCTPKLTRRFQQDRRLQRGQRDTRSSLDVHGADARRRSVHRPDTHSTTLRRARLRTPARSPDDGDNRSRAARSTASGSQAALHSVPVAQAPLRHAQRSARWRGTVTRRVDADTAAAATTHLRAHPAG